MNVMMLTEDGGRARYLESALPLFAEFGVNLTVASLSDRGPLHQSAEQVTNLRAIALRSKRRNAYAGAVRNLRKLVRTTQFDVVHAHEVIPAAIMGLARGRRSAPRLIFHRHHTFSSRRHAVFSRFAAAQCDLLVGISEAARQAALLHDRCPPSKAVAAHNGVPPAPTVSQHALQQVSRALMLEPEDRVILSVGRLREEKGYRTFVEAASLLAASLKEKARFVIVGEGPEKESLTHQARSLGVRVALPGHQEEVYAWYLLSDVVVQPSYSDAFPLTVLEAMACARPVIGSHVGGIPEAVVDNQTGLLVPPKDPSSLALAFANLLQDRDLRERMAVEGRRRYEAEFTSREMVRRWVECYERVLKRGKGAGYL